MRQRLSAIGPPPPVISDKTGHGIVGLFGAGVRVLVGQGTGYGSVGLVGSGESQQIDVNSGYGTVGTVGSGAKQVSGGTTLTKTGYATVGTVGTGASALTSQDTGYARIGLLGSGWSAIGPISADVYDAYALLRDEKAANTNGGSPVGTTWTKHALGTEVFDPDGIVSISSDVFTLAAGAYWVQAWAVSHQTNGWKIKIRDTTAGADVVIGSSVYGPAGVTGGLEAVSTLNGRLTPSGTTTYELQYYAQATTAGANGLGIPTNAGVVEVYAEVLIMREGAGSLLLE